MALEKQIIIKLIIIKSNAPKQTGLDILSPKKICSEKRLILSSNKLFLIYLCVHVYAGVFKEHLFKVCNLHSCLEEKEPDKLSNFSE